MEYRIYTPDNPDDLAQQIERLEKTHYELLPTAGNKGTADRIAQIEAEHADLTARLDAIPTPDPMQLAIDEKIQEIKAAQIQNEIFAALEPLKSDDELVDCDAALARLSELRGEPHRSAVAEEALAAKEAAAAELTSNLAAAYTAPPTLFERIFGQS